MKPFIHNHEYITAFALEMAGLVVIAIAIALAYVFGQNLLIGLALVWIAAYVALMHID